MERQTGLEPPQAGGKSGEKIPQEPGKEGEVG